MIMLDIMCRLKNSVINWSLLAHIQSLSLDPSKTHIKMHVLDGSFTFSLLCA